jgi:hypothetical protein
VTPRWRVLAPSTGSSTKFTQTMEIKKKTCIFCGDTTSSSKASEHIIPSWILKLLNAEDEVDPWSERKTKATEDGTIIPELQGDSRMANYDQLRNGLVCDTCNHGWMSELESEIQPTLKPLILGFHSLPSLSNDEKVKIARWATKTTCVLDSVSPAEKSNIIGADSSVIRTSRSLAPGWAVFYTTRPPSRRISFDRCSNWCVSPVPTLPPDEVKTRLSGTVRTVIQVGHLVLLTVYVGHDGLRLRAVRKVHDPLSTSLVIEWQPVPIATSYRYEVTLSHTSSENFAFKWSDALSIRVLSVGDEEQPVKR